MISSTGSHVGDQPVVTDHHGGLPHVRLAAEEVLDLPGVEAIAADLDLAAGPPQEDQGTVVAVAGEVAAAVEPGARLPRERIGQEPGRGQVRPAEVAACRRLAADVQLAGEPGGTRRIPASSR